MLDQFDKHGNQVVFQQDDDPESYVSGRFEQVVPSEQEQQTDLTINMMSEQEEYLDNLVHNFDFIREVVRKYMRLDISSGYKHAFDQRQKEKIVQKFEQKTSINQNQVEKMFEQLQQQMLNQSTMKSVALDMQSEATQNEINKYKAQIYDLQQKVDTLERSNNELKLVNQTTTLSSEIHLNGVGTHHSVKGGSDTKVSREEPMKVTSA